MKIMYLAFEGFDTQNGTNHLALKIIDELLANQFEVYLVSSHSTGIFDDIPLQLKDREGFTYDIIKRKSVRKTAFVKRYWNGLSYAFRAMREWYKHIKNIDVVILQSTPTVVFSSILLKLFSRKPIIFNCYDIFPDGLKLNGAITNKIILFLLNMIQKIVYRTSAKIISISADMKKTLISLGVSDDKIVVIYPWYDDHSIKRIEDCDNLFLRQNNLKKDKFIVQYAGNFGYTFDYKMVLTVAEILKNEIGIVFHMIGDGAFSEKFKTESQKKKLENIIFFPWQNAELLSHIYSYCDVGLIPLSKGVIYYSFPSKGSLLMACGKCFICATEENSDYFHMINNNKVGLCISRDSPQDVASAISLLYSNALIKKQYDTNALIFSRKMFSSRENINIIKSLILELANGKNVYVRK